MGGVVRGSAFLGRPAHRLTRGFARSDAGSEACYDIDESVLGFGDVVLRHLAISSPGRSLRHGVLELANIDYRVGKILHVTSLTVNGEASLTQSMSLNPFLSSPRHSPASGEKPAG